MRKSSKIKGTKDEVTAQDLSKMIGRDESMIYRYFRSGYIPGQKRGPYIFFKKTIGQKILLAMMIADKKGAAWHELIEWAPEDMYEFSQNSSEVKTPEPTVKDFDRVTYGTTNSMLPKHVEMMKMAKRLEALNERELAARVSHRVVLEMSV